MNWKIRHSRRVYDGHFKVDRIVLRHELFTGDFSDDLIRERVTRQDAVAVLPYDPHRDEVVLVEQFRIGALEREHTPWLVEIIAGLVEPGEGLEDVARRESIEEANCRLEALYHAASFFPSPGGFSEIAHVYIGRTSTLNLGGVCGIRQEGEDIRVKVVSSQRADEMLATGVIRSAIPMIALLRFKKLKDELRRKWLR